MIYGNMIYEQQFNSLIDNPLESLKEFYENEIDILNSIINEANEIVRNDKIIDADYEETESKNLADSTKDGFVKRAIEKIKEIIQKFIEWCKKLMESIKNFFLKDTKTIINELNEVIKNVEKAQSYEEVKKAAKSVGRIKDDTVTRFNGKNYIIDSVSSLRKDYEKLIKNNNNLLDDIFKDLYRDSKLSEQSSKNIKNFLEEIKTLKVKNTVSKGSYLVISHPTIKDLNLFKKMIIDYAKEDINTLLYIEKMSNKITKDIKDLQNESKFNLNKIKAIKNDTNSKDIALVASTVNAVISSGKRVYQEELKILNSVKNIYRFTK